MKPDKRRVVTLGGLTKLHKPFTAKTGALEHFSIRLGVARVCEISFAFVFGNPFEKRGDCFPLLPNPPGWRGLTMRLRALRLSHATLLAERVGFEPSVWML